MDIFFGGQVHDPEIVRENFNKIKKLLNDLYAIIGAIDPSTVKSFLQEAIVLTGGIPVEIAFPEAIEVLYSFDVTAYDSTTGEKINAGIQAIDLNKFNLSYDVDVTLNIFVVYRKGLDISEFAIITEDGILMISESEDQLVTEEY